MKLDLHDLKPIPAQFTLEDFPNEKLTLKRVSLNDRIWINANFTTEEIERIFQTSSIPEIVRIAYHLLAEKDRFKTFAEFCEVVVTQRDQANVMVALLTTIGISEPVIKDLARQQDLDDKKKAKTKDATGPKSMTASLPSTDIPSTNS